MLSYLSKCQFYDTLVNLGSVQARWFLRIDHGKNVGRDNVCLSTSCARHSWTTCLRDITDSKDIFVSVSLVLDLHGGFYHDLFCRGADGRWHKLFENGRVGALSSARDLTTTEGLVSLGTARKHHSIIMEMRTTRSYCDFFPSLNANSPLLPTCGRSPKTTLMFRRDMASTTFSCSFGPKLLSN